MANKNVVILSLLLLLSVYGAIGQDFAHGQGPQSDTVVPQPQMRKDLNELPEMRKAKELRTEAEKAELEAERMRELAKLEAELKEEDSSTQATEKTVEEKGDKSNASGEQHKSMESTPGLKAPIAEPIGQTETHEVTPADEHSEEEKEAENGPKANGQNSTETGQKGEEAGEKHGLEPMMTSAPVQQQEPLVTTQKSLSGSVISGEEPVSGPEDPFQTSSTTTPPVNGQQKQKEQGPGHEMEHEVIQQTVHVHHPSAEEMGGGQEKQGEEEEKHGKIVGGEAVKEGEEADKTEEAKPEEAQKEEANAEEKKSEEKKPEMAPMEAKKEGEEAKKPEEAHDEANKEEASKEGEAKKEEELIPGGSEAEESGNTPAAPIQHETLIAEDHQQKPKEEESKEGESKEEEEAKDLPKEEETTSLPKGEEHPKDLPKEDSHPKEEDHPKDLPKEESEEESKEDADVHHQVTAGHVHAEHGQQETTTFVPASAAEAIASGEVHGPKTEEGMAPESGKEEEDKAGEKEGAHVEAVQPNESSSSSVDERPIVFPVQSSLHTQQPSSTTEESAVIAGDKSVFEKSGEDEKLPGPEKAVISHMSHEGELQETTQAPMPGIDGLHPSSVPMVNEGSDGFELITKEEQGDSPGTASEKPASHTPEEVKEEEPEVLPTPAEESSQKPFAVGEVDHMHAHGMSMPSSTMMSPAEGTTMMEMMPAEGHDHDHEAGMMETTELMPGHSEQPTVEDTPPQRGDLPGETSQSMPSSTMATEEGRSSTEEDKTANGVEQQEQTDETASSPPMTTMSPEDIEAAKSKAYRTPFSIRLSDIEWRPEFGDLQSGATKKLVEQIGDDLRAALTAALGPANSLVDFELTGLRQGSVILDGQMLTKEEVQEPQALAAALEQAILAKNGELGGNHVDTDQLNVAGNMPSSSSSNNVMAAGQQKQQEQEAATNMGLIIGGAVVVGVLIVVFAIFAIVVFGLNNRRNNCGTLKLSGKEEICMVENGKGGGIYGRGPFTAGIPNTVDGEGSNGVNLMSLRTSAGSNTPTINAHNGNGRMNGNGTPILLGGSSQFSPSSHPSYGNGNGGSRP